MPDVADLEVLSDEIVGKEGGFLAIRRMRMRNVRPDGSVSEPYLVDFLVRPKGLDAVVVAVYHRTDAGVQVLLRDGLRPPLKYGRDEPKPLPDPREYMFFREVCAGIIEVEDEGEAGLRSRAAIEVEEESGFVVPADRVVILGGGVFPSPGAMAERFYLTAVEVDDPGESRIPEGDGSPMEDGARIHWMDLDDAIAGCVAGEIEDAKTEICLRRLRDYLDARDRK